MTASHDSDIPNDALSASVSAAAAPDLAQGEPVRSEVVSAAPTSTDEATASSGAASAQGFAASAGEAPASAVSSAANAAGAAATSGISAASELKSVNGLGLSCPEPLMLLRLCIRKSASGQLIELLSDDPVSLRDVPAFCSFMNHELVAMPDADHPHRYIIRKG